MGVPTANLSRSCVMVLCPGALSFLRSNLTMLMSSFGSMISYEHVVIIFVMDTITD